MRERPYNFGVRCDETRRELDDVRKDIRKNKRGIFGVGLALGAFMVAGINNIVVRCQLLGEQKRHEELAKRNWARATADALKEQEDS